MQAAARIQVAVSLCIRSAVTGASRDLDGTLTKAQGGAAELRGGYGSAEGLACALAGVPAGQPSS